MVEPLVAIVAILVAVLIIFIGIITLRPSTAVKDAETLSRLSGSMLQQSLDLSQARSRIDGQRIDNLTRQVRALGGDTITIEQAADRAGVPLNVFDVGKNKSLRSALVDLFSAGELTILVRDVGLDAQELPGATKTEIAVSLIDAAERRGLTYKLIEEIKRARPSAKGINGD